ncbi:RNA polymerase II transcription factor B subunit 3 [Phakopsora pachyrhizi]|uniref:RNA polymerase II transcription factor B subunit 3 n=1 Tax=Phakopsora pachyrhizi TaxID=170000 RepID=A0AAV0AEY9_PHAPC|nr:RNA polymerase II transcription factor B subunit 3 [Phakopsora pachyrhizi]
MSMRKPVSGSSKFGKRSTNRTSTSSSSSSSSNFFKTQTTSNNNSFNPSQTSKIIVGSINGQNNGPKNLQSDQTGRIAEFFSESDVCPVCKSDRYLNPNLRLLVSRCYHKMCESCIDRIFSLGPEPCPICGQILRKINFAPQTFENLSVEKEVVIRRRISKYFNKRREDFKSLEAYNNYLEEVEDITFNLINGVDVAETEAKIKQFQIENQELIAQNAVHEARQAELNKRREEILRKERETRKAELIRLEEEARREELELKNATIQSLENSDVSAEKLVARQRLVAQKRAAARELATELASKSKVMMPSLSGLIDPSASKSFEGIRPDIDAELAQWDDYSQMFDLRQFETHRPAPYLDEESLRFVLSNDGLALVGGYDIGSYWERQLRTAMMGLFVPPPEPGSINNEISKDISSLSST